MTALLWEYPRPLLTAVVPTALRRLSCNWRLQGRPQEDDFLPNSPLPDFAPSSFFSDLNLPEVRIIVPGTHANSKARQEVMPIARHFGYLPAAGCREDLVPMTDAFVTGSLRR